MVLVGFPVRYIPHAEHEHLSEFAATGLAAIVGRVHPDGSADLLVFQPNKEPAWQDAVPFGEGPHTFDQIRPPAELAGATAGIQIAETSDVKVSDNVVTLNAGTVAPTDPPQG